ncbi:MAG: YicC/YloC family endoribonuclease, partial [Xanthobacteraceae bacterium]
MALSSMTGFARGHGVSGSYAWAWEIKSVNGKGLDVRLRLPSGWDAIDAPVRARVAERLARGSVQASLMVERSGATPVVRINAAVLEAIMTTVRQLAPRLEAAPPSLDGLL